MIQFNSQKLNIYLTAENTYSIGWDGFPGIQHKCNHREVFNIITEQVAIASALSENELKVYLLMTYLPIKETKSIAGYYGFSINAVESIKSKICRKLGIDRETLSSKKSR